MIEQTIAIGGSDRLMATLCLPAETNAGPGGVGFVLMNAGIIHRVGPHRVNVKLARRLAAMGVPSIRLDLSGLGDSGRPSGGLSYDQQSVEDIRAAMNALEAQCGVSRFGIFGLCSGTVNGLAAAMADERVVGIELLEPYLYPTPRTRSNYFRLRVKKYLSQGRVLQGVGRLVSMISARLSGTGKSGGRNAGGSGEAAAGVQAPSNAFFSAQPEIAEFAEMLEKLAARGVNVNLMYVGGGMHRYNYQNQFLDVFPQFATSRHIQSVFLPDADHTLTRVAVQQDFLARIEASARRLRG
jgi:hypothetical protein